MDKEEEAAFVPRPSHHPIFDRLQYTKTEGKGLVHVNVVSVYLGRQMGGLIPHQKNELEALSCSFSPKCWSIQTFAKQKTYHYWFKMKNACAKCVLSIGDPSSPR